MTPIERAAQAARQAEDDRLCGILGPWNQATDETREAWIGIARAVITAIREPSEAMLGAAYGECHSPEDVPEHIWQTMIDAMLEEG